MEYRGQKTVVRGGGRVRFDLGSGGGGGGCGDVNTCGNDVEGISIDDGDDEYCEWEW